MDVSREKCRQIFTNYFKSHDIEYYEKMGNNVEKSIFNETIKYGNDNKLELSWNVLNVQYKKYYFKVISNIKSNPCSGKIMELIKDGKLRPTKIVSMEHREIDPEKWELIEKKIQDKIDRCNIKKKKKIGMFVCGRCKSKDTDYKQAQLSSGDEPMHTMVYCNNCENRWKFR
jgi:transcription elongation factor S-II